MTETQFIEQNKEKWKELESLLTRRIKDPDRLHELFAKVSADLSYARTFFPNRSVRLYLNNLTQQVFDLIRHQENKFELASLINFFQSRLPSEIYRSRRAFYISMLVFFTAILVGVVSSLNDPEFPTVILGEDYIAMTEQNIAAGDPMAVYKNRSRMDMFLTITVNNIRVAFLAFVMGLLGGVGTILILVVNGIMVGAFQYYFYSKGLFLTSFLTIWIHGTLEISAIVIAGASGLILGQGLVFPNTYDRLISLQINAKRALTILMGTIPLFVIAGLLESFVTRNTGWPDAIRWSIILFSLIFVVGMWIIVPLLIRRSAHRFRQEDPPPIHLPPLDFNRFQVRSLTQNLLLAFAKTRLFMGPYIKFVLAPGFIISMLLYYYRLQTLDLSDYELSYQTPDLFTVEYGGISLFILYLLTLTLAFTLLSLFNRDQNRDSFALLNLLREKWIAVGLLVAIPLAIWYFLNDWVVLILLLIITPMALTASIDTIGRQSSTTFADLGKIFRFSWQRYFQFLAVIGITILIMLIFTALINSGLLSFFVDLITWHDIFDHSKLDEIYVLTLFKWMAFLFIIPPIYFLLNHQYDSEICKEEAIDLKERFQHFGKLNSNLEQT